VTVLFSDLTGYTTLSERLDPEETRTVMASIFRHATKIVGRYEARIEKFLGDAMLAVFGVPHAHEDDPVRAVRTALELHQAVESLGRGIGARLGVELRLHSGINTGLVVTGELEFERGSMGDTINVASRLMNLAAPGEILVGPETRKLLARAFELEDLGPQPLKGKAEPVAVARVRGSVSRPAAPAHSRGAFIGRHEEMGILMGAVEQLRDGQPGVIAICGEAGTGKTRLVDELHARIGADVQWLEGRAYPYAENIPYFPLIDLLNRSWGIGESDTPTAVRQTVETGIGALVESPGDVFPVVARLYGIEVVDGPVIDPEAFQGLLLDAVHRLLSAFARRAPTVICLQDLHWADASTVALLHDITADFRIPALLVGNHRPGYTPSPGARIIQLRELSVRQTRELLQSLLGSEPPEVLTRFIEERSDGNPFYVEEVVNSLVETHVLTRNGTWNVAGSLIDAAVPTTIRGVIAARIDRLDEPRRRVLRDAAVVGREFLYSVVAQVTENTDGLEASLEQLEAADLVRARSRQPDIEYIFKHALTQEVAYEGLLKSERQTLHERAALAMERIFVDRIPEFVETLAYHFRRGGVVEKAVHYLIEAGKKCVARYAIADAAVHYRQAYELLVERERTPAEDRMLVELLIAWSVVYYYEGDCNAWRRLLEAHQDVAEAVGDPELLSLYLSWVGWVHFFYQEYTAGLERLDRAVRLAEVAKSRRALGYAEALRAWTLCPLGRTREAIEAGERGAAVGRDFPDETYLVWKSMAGVTFAAFVSGDLERARRGGEEILRIAERTSNSRAGVLGHCVLAMRHMLALEPERAIAAAQAGIETPVDTTYWSMSCAFATVALAYAERWEEVARVVDLALPKTERLSLLFMASFLRLSEGLAAMARGEPSRGMAVVEGIRDRPPSPLAKIVAEFTLGVTYARIARREVRAPLSVLLRNPGFVIRHALPARRKAHAILERIADDSPDGMHGYSGLAMLELALLHADAGDPAEAEGRALRAIDIFERQSAPEAIRRARRLADSLRGASPRK
jgi:class 3 adenylate cyclase/tetratricopeptide (TPR) repeat protein